MPVAKNFTVRTLRTVPPGQLVRLEMSGPTLAIVMTKNEQHDTAMLVVLSSSEEILHPFWTTVSEGTEVMCYGAEWILDVGDARDSYPGNYNQAEKPGTIAVVDESFLLWAGPDWHPGSRRKATFDLTECRLINRAMAADRTVYATEWVIWRNQAERDRVGGKPMFEFTAPPEATEA